MKLDKKIEETTDYGKDRIVVTDYDENTPWNANIYRIDSEDNIIWQIEPTDDLSRVGRLGDFYTYCWYEEGILVVITFSGHKHQLDPETGKRIKYLGHFKTT